MLRRGAMALVVATLAVCSPQLAPAGPSPLHRCDRAVIVDGGLRCDEAAPHTVGELCPGHHESSRAVVAGDVLDTQRLCAAQGAGHGRMSAARLQALGVALDPNRAPVRELVSWPGVGPVLARRIVANRPYARPQDLLRVRGIGEVRLANIRPRLRIVTQAADSSR